MFGGGTGNNSFRWTPQRPKLSLSAVASGSKLFSPCAVRQNVPRQRAAKSSLSLRSAVAMHRAHSAVHPVRYTCYMYVEPLYVRGQLAHVPVDVYVYIYHCLRSTNTST